MPLTPRSLVMSSASWTTFCSGSMLQDTIQGAVAVIEGAQMSPSTRWRGGRTARSFPRWQEPQPEDHHGEVAETLVDMPPVGTRHLVLVTRLQMQLNAMASGAA